MSKPEAGSVHQACLERADSLVIMLARAAFAVLLLGLVGCSKPSTEAYVVATERLATIVDRYAHNCDQMAEALDQFMRDEAEPIRTYQAHQTRLDRGEKDELEHPPYERRIHRAMEKLVPGHQACLEHPGVRAAFMKI